MTEKNLDTLLHKRRFEQPSDDLAARIIAQAQPKSVVSANIFDKITQLLFARPVYVLAVAVLLFGGVVMMQIPVSYINDEPTAIDVEYALLEDYLYYGDLEI